MNQIAELLDQLAFAAGVSILMQGSGAAIRMLGFAIAAVAAGRLIERSHDALYIGDPPGFPATTAADAGFSTTDRGGGEDPSDEDG